MAKGTTVDHSTFSKPRGEVYSKKIAIQFTDAQFKEINAIAEKRGLSFSAIVRSQLFDVEPVSA